MYRSTTVHDSFVIFALLALFPLTSLAQPSVSTAIPGAVKPGATTEVTLNGAKLDGPLSIWTSFPAKVEIVPPADGRPNPAKITCKITVDANVPVGLGGVIVANGAGVSNTLMMLVDDLPSVQASGSNTRLASAQVLTLPTAVDGASPGSASAFYKFNATAGQRVSIEVHARRMTSPLDPVIWLRDAQGRELAYADDDDRLGVDCRLAYQFESAGEYIVEIRDNAFAGGRRYRLRIGDFPLVSTAYPLGVKVGEQTKLNFVGPSIAGVEPRTTTVQSTSGLASVGAKIKGGVSSAIVTIAATNLDESLETEPNDKVAAATKVTIPCAVNGVLQTPGDKDHFQFDAKKGQRLVLKSFSRSLGSATYAAMKVLKPDGGQLAASGVGDAEEQTLRYTIPADGTYLLAVSDLLHRSADDLSYRVSIQPGAGFSLNVKHDPRADAAGNAYKRLASTSGMFTLGVDTKRDGYNGPITLAVESDAGEFKLLNNVIAEKATTTTLIAMLPDSLKEGTFTKIRVVGRAKVNDMDVEVVADTFNLMRAKWKHVSYPPAWHDGLIALSTAKPLDPFFDIKVNGPIHFAASVGTANITVTPERKNKDFKAGLTVLVDSLPEPLKATVKLNGKVPSETYQVTLTGPKDLADGDRKLRLLAYTSFKGRTEKIVKEISIEVVTPLTVTLAPAGPIVIGQKQKVKVIVTRPAGSDRQPITLTWTKLPAGITGPTTPVSVNADIDKLEVDFELTAAADAKPGTFTDLVVQAVTKFQGQDITVPNTPTKLEVKSK